MNTKPTRTPYDLVFDFPAVAAGANNSFSLRIDTGDPFLVEGIVSSVFLPTAQTAVAFTGLPREGSPTAAGGTLPTHDAFRVYFTLKANALMNNPQRLSNFAGSAENPRIPLTQWVFIPGETLIGTFYNDAATYTVQSQITFYGSRISTADLASMGIRL